MVLPHFATTGPPEFISDSGGVIVGLTLETQRGTIAKGILEGVTYYLRACVESLPAAGIAIDEYRVVGGGSQSDAWVQLSADILGVPFARPRVTEAGTLGAAILAGAGVGEFGSIAQGAEAMVQVERVFESGRQRAAEYDRWFERYARLWPLVSGYVREVMRAQRDWRGGD
jgi:xylulokinase